jgi:glycosyltransferase involved in cell wall biosynthesis
VPRVSDCAAILPCLNEAAAIGPLVARLREMGLTVIVVDDGSRDETAARASAAGADVIAQPRNLGKGAALARGLQRARERGLAWAVTMDGDGQHAPEDVPALLTAAAEGGAALIVGNRMVDPRPMPWLRRAVNRWMSDRLSRRAGQPLPDTQCGFRMIHLDSWSRLRLRTSHFEFESEMLLAFAAAGHTIRFVPVQVIYKRGRSHIRPLLDTWRWFRWWWAPARKAGSGQEAAPVHGRAPSFSPAAVSADSTSRTPNASRPEAISSGPGADVRG